MLKENIILKGEFKEKLKYSKIFGKQHEKYSYIKNNIQTQLSIHQNLHNDMKNFDSTTRSYYLNEMKTKKIVYTKTEYELSKTKKEILKSKSSLVEIKNRISLQVQSVAIRNIGNDKKSLEYKNHLKDYLKDYVRLDRIKKILKEADLDILITKFKSGQIQYNGSKKMVILNYFQSFSLPR